MIFDIETLQGGCHDRWNHVAHVTSKRGELLDGARAEDEVFLIRRHEEGLDFRTYTLVEY